MADTPAVPPAPPGFSDVPAAPAGFVDAPKQPITSPPLPSGIPEIPYPDMTVEESTAARQAAAAKVAQRTPPGALMAVVNQAFKLDEPLGISPETEKSMADAGLFNDYVKGRYDFRATFNEAILRPAANVGDLALRTLNAAVVLPVGLTGAAIDAVKESMGIRHDSAEDNAYHAQQFNDDLTMVLGVTSGEGAFSSFRGASERAPEAAVPPSAQRALTVIPKPWQAEVAPAAEKAALKEAPPVTNLPAVGSPEASAAEQTLPANPADPINHSNPVLDGSGNLNLDYIRADDDTKSVMAKTSQAYADKYGTVVSHAETVEQANAFFDEALGQVTNGIPDVLGDYKRADPVNRDLLWTARQVSVQLATQFSKLSKTASATGDPADAEAAKAMFARMVQVVGPVRHEMTAELGRTMNAMKIPVGDAETGITEDAAQKMAGMNVGDAMRIAGTLDTPQKVAKFVADVQKPSFADMGMYYIFNNYLSGPLTHLAYTASWGVQTVIRAGIETPIASAIGKIQRMAGKTLEPGELTALGKERADIADRLAEADRKGSNRPLTAVESQQFEKRLQEINDKLKNGVTVMPHEAAARFYGIGEGALDSIRAFGRALKTSDIQMLPGEMQKATEASKEAELKALEKGALPEDAKAAGQAAYRDRATNFGNPIVQYGEMMKNPAGSAAVKALGHTIGAPMRVIAAIHSLQKFSGYAESMNALAYRQAASEGIEGGRAAMMNDTTDLGKRIAAIKNNPTPEMMKQAVDESKYAALMGQSGAAGKKFQSLANANAWTRVVVPFSKVVTNLTAQKVLERTPIGVLSEVVRGNMLGKNGAAAQATQIAKMLTGSTLLTGGAYLASQGVSHGWGSDDKNERAFQYLSGNAPYSVNIGDINLPHRFFGVAGGSLSLGADIHDISQALSESDEGWGDWLAVMGTSVHYIGRDVLSENALTGPAELYNAINDRENAAKYFVPNAIASAFVPYSSFQSQLTHTRFIDPIMRQTVGDDSYSRIMETVQSRTPFLSDRLMPKVDIFGNPMKRNGDHSWAEKDPVMQALSHLEIYPAAVTPKLFGVDLDEKQFADYATIAGRSFYSQLLPQVSSPKWVRLSDRAQAEVIQAAIKASRAQARGTMALLYPQIVKDSAQQKLDLLHQYDADQ